MDRLYEILSQCFFPPGDVTTAAMGNPLPMPFAIVTISGMTLWPWKPQKWLPVRPNPVWTCQVQKQMDLFAFFCSNVMRGGNIPEDTRAALPRNFLFVESITPLFHALVLALTLIRKHSCITLNAVCVTSLPLKQSIAAISQRWMLRYAEFLVWQDKRWEPALTETENIWPQFTPPPVPIFFFKEPNTVFTA